MINNNLELMIEIAEAEMAVEEIKDKRKQLKLVSTKD
jgi:hypothetical protein